MNRVKTSPESFTTIYKRHTAGESVASLCKELNVSPSSYYNWAKTFNKGTKVARKTATRKVNLNKVLARKGVAKTVGTEDQSFAYNLIRFIVKSVESGQNFRF